MKVQDIEDFGSKILVKIPETKTNKPRSFIINETYLNVYRKYVSFRPNDFENPRFFFKFNKGKGWKTVIGINLFGKMPQIVASYLQLPNSTEYTGHCFRRSSATHLVDAGADILSLKRHGGWKSSNVAEEYIDESLNNKVEVANKIFNTPASTSNENDRNEINQTISHAGSTSINSRCPPVQFTNCTNCTINVNINNN